jgi:microcystin-dependent protein
MNLFNVGGVNYIDYAERNGTNFTETERMYWPSGGADAAHNENTGTGIGIVGSTDANSSSTTVSITNANNTGGGSATPVTQPTLVLNYIIKATQ